MRHFTTCLISISLLTLTAQNAIAERAGLLQLANLRQRFNLSYQFDGSQAQDTSSSQHGAVQGYSIGFDYAVIRPTILTGSIDLNVNYQENMTSGSEEGGYTSGLGFLYNIGGTFLGRSAFPARFFVNSTTSDVPTSFGQSYTLTSDSYGVLWGLQNKYLPLATHYSETTSKTDGLTVDRTSTHKEFGFDISHIKGISASNVNLLNSRDDYASTLGTDSTTSRNFEAKFSNTLNWTEGVRVRNLNTNLRYNASEGLNDFKNLELSESLTWDLGKALKSGLYYTFLNRVTPVVTQTTNSGNIWLTHKLFESLLTQLAVSARDMQVDTGFEKQVAGKAALGYSKILPSNSRFNAQVYREYGVTEQKLSSGELFIQDEPHVVIFSEQPIILAQRNVVSSSIVVKNRDPLLRTDPYDPNAVPPDYSVVQLPDERTGIFVSDAGLSNIIPEGTVLLISYTYLANTDVKFSTDSMGGNGELSLYSEKYRIYGSYDQSRQDLISGQIDQAALNSITSYRAGVSAVLKAVTYTVEYGGTSSGSDVHQSVLGSVRYSGEVADGILSLYAKDRYQWYDTTDTGGSNVVRSPENNFSTGANFRKAVLGSGMLTLLTDYQMTSGTYESQTLTGGVYFTWRIGKLSLSLQARGGYRTMGSSTYQDEHVRFNLSRYF